MKPVVVKGIRKAAPQGQREADLTALAEAVQYLLSSNTAAEAQTLRQRVVKIIDRRRGGR